MPRTSLPKILVVLPVYNEERTIANMLDRLDKRADILVCVNDGSKDRSLGILTAFARRRRNTYIVDQPKNSGMAGALKAGFLFVLYLQKKGLVAADDIVVTIDADGQHKPEYIPSLVKYLARRGADVVLTRRNFDVYPLYKVLGNRFLTWTNSLLSGMAYQDVESGLRLLKVKTLRSILEYYTGVKYSCAQEIALVSARAGFKIYNNFQVDIAYYRAGTTVWDGFIVLGLSFWCFLRWLMKAPARVDFETSLMKKSFEKSRSLWKNPKKMKS
jgi:glycosyltransferase involved in cell wall biosynthesis